ncbi:MAG TPA: alpha/beta hydrolase [Acidimicrobiales bacterium]|nr:alpha/beta hydrolase [Acidimicrobiales bacterium]
MTTYALVHGAWHGAWCWEPLAKELEKRGHRAVAMDLPCEDPKAGTSDYADAVVRTLDGVDDDVVVVGHSLAGLTIPVVAMRRPVRKQVYLCALIRAPGLSMADRPDENADMAPPEFGAGIVGNDDGTNSIPRDTAAAFLYQDLTPEQIDWAMARLRRQGGALWGETAPYTEWPDTEYEYILGRDDRAVVPTWSRREAQALLGVTAIELEGSHSPMVSRPAELADVLTR